MYGWVGFQKGTCRRVGYIVSIELGNGWKDIPKGSCSRVESAVSIGEWLDIYTEGDL